MATFALFEDETAVATVVGSPMTQQVRGEVYDTSAIWGVTTHPTARRKGYCRRLMARLLATQRDEGQPLSCLYPFRASFYERLGYVTFPLPGKATFAPSALRSLLEKDLGGQVELMLIADGYDTYRDYLHRLQGRTHGMGVFVRGEKERVQKENRSWLALASVDGELVGLMLYCLEGEQVTQFTLRAQRFYYDTSQARYLLLQWIARHVDQAGQVELWLPPFEQPETWLADIQVSTESLVRAPMGRVVDVGSIGGMETGPGRFAARVSDPLCPWNTDVWQFQTVDGRLQVRPVRQADCDLTIQALAALIYGTHDPADFVFRGWGDPSSAVQATMRTMFPPRVPYLHEYF
jgi:predicted acetyltransferase